MAARNLPHKNTGPGRGEHPDGHSLLQERASRSLGAVRHFAGLPPHVRAEVVRAAVYRQFEPGQVIYLEGEPAKYLYILASGWVKSVRMSPDGREQGMLFLQPGEIFGDVAVFNQIPYPGTVIALEKVEVWAIGQNDVLALVERHGELAMAVIRRLSERVLYYVNLVEDLSLRSVEARLAHTLIRHTEVQEGRLVVPRRNWTTIEEMATRLGTVRDVLGRTLRALEDEGLIRVERNTIQILDPNGLSRRGDPSPE